MGKVSAAKKQREKKRLDKLFQKKEKEEKMRKVLASLAVIAPEKKHTDAKKAPVEEEKKKEQIVDKEAMYKEMRSSKNMKRKWRESHTARTQMPRAEDGENISESSDEADEMGYPDYDYQEQDDI